MTIRKYGYFLLFLGITLGCASDYGEETMPAPEVDMEVSPTPDQGEQMIDTADMGIPTAPADPDEGEPQAYVYPASLDSATTPGYTVEDCRASALTRVRGWVVDRIGRPIMGARAQLCVTNENGTGSCLMPTSNDGWYLYPRYSRGYFMCSKSGLARDRQPYADDHVCEIDLTTASDLGETVLESRVSFMRP